MDASVDKYRCLSEVILYIQTVASESNRIGNPLVNKPQPILLDVRSF